MQWKKKLFFGERGALWLRPYIIHFYDEALKFAEYLECILASSCSFQFGSICKHTKNLFGMIFTFLWLLFFEITLWIM